MSYANATHNQMNKIETKYDAINKMACHIYMLKGKMLFLNKKSKSRKDRKKKTLKSGKQPIFERIHKLFHSTSDKRVQFISLNERAKTQG